MLVPDTPGPSAGSPVVVDMPGWYCGASGESIHDGSDMKVSDRALNALKAKVERCLDLQAVRRIRKKLGLTQKDAVRLIGGGPKAFQKYESGDVLASGAITSALLLLDRDPGGLDVLRNREEVIDGGC